jgi:hypothetical protein
MSTQGFGPWPAIDGVWHLADGTDGWYVVSPDGGECGPFTEDEAGRAKERLMRGLPPREGVEQ